MTGRKDGHISLPVGVITGNRFLAYAHAPGKPNLAGRREGIGRGCIDLSAEGESHAKAPRAGGGHGQYDAAKLGICLRNRLKGLLLVRGCPLKITACALY